MPAYKDKAKGTWYASFYYEDWTGKKVKKMKRGFPTKREALEWERTLDINGYHLFYGTGTGKYEVYELFDQEGNRLEHIKE